MFFGNNGQIHFMKTEVSVPCSREELPSGQFCGWARSTSRRSSG